MKATSGLRDLDPRHVALLVRTLRLRGVYCLARDHDAYLRAEALIDRGLVTPTEVEGGRILFASPQGRCALHRQVLLKRRSLAEVRADRAVARADDRTEKANLREMEARKALRYATEEVAGAYDEVTDAQQERLRLTPLSDGAVRLFARLVARLQREPADTMEDGDERDDSVFFRPEDEEEWRAARELDACGYALLLGHVEDDVEGFRLHGVEGSQGFWETKIAAEYAALANVASGSNEK